MRLKTELEVIIESLDLFEENKQNVEESLDSTPVEKGSKIENMINIDVEKKGFEKKCYIMWWFWSCALSLTCVCITKYKDGQTFCLLYPKSCLLDHHLNVKLFMPKL